MRDAIINLNNEILDANEAYYAGSPVMPDSEYDAKIVMLSSLVAANPTFRNLATVLDEVGYSAYVGISLQHSTPMLSIENYFTIETFIAASNNYGPFLLVEPKRDGISCSLKYENGILIQALTRGRGTEGEDMTAQVKACKNIPNQINYSLPIEFRGEIVMPNSELSRINSLGGKKIYSNTRNLVAGTFKQKDLNIVASRNCFFIPWDVLGNGLTNSAFDRMQFAESLGFPKYQGMRIANNEKDIRSALSLVLENNKISDINADGVVIKAENYITREALGIKNKFTNYQHCFKPQNLSGETKVLDVEFAIGRTGKLSMVAILEPINLGGAVTSRATLNNETYIHNLGVRIGARVSVIRSGDVIPFITGVIDSTNSTPIIFPTHCPACKTKLAFDKSDVIIQRFCTNSLCAGRAIEQLSFVGGRETLEIDNLGDSMAEELVKNGITNLADLFEFANETHSSTELKKNFRSAVNTGKMISSLQTAKTASWSKWLPAMGIEHLGHTFGKTLANFLALDSEDMINLPLKLKSIAGKNIDGIGVVKLQAILDWANDKNNAVFCERLYEAGVRPTSTVVKKVGNMPLSGIVFCCTGSFNLSRPDITKKMEALGAVASSSMSSKVNLAIIGEDAGSKADKALSLGIKIVGQKWLNENI